ncbi:MAG: class I SAM-dependent methyltransferase [Planctomycetota bacterium]
MNQPPRSTETGSGGRDDFPAWRRPPGVARGTWRYCQERSIADRYDDFVADTPLCELDLRWIQSELFGSLTPGNSTGRPARVIDFGCGTGRATNLLTARGVDVVAVDLSRDMLRHVRRSHIAQRLAASKEDRHEPGQLLPVQANLVQLDAIASQCMDAGVCLLSTYGMIQGRENRIAFLGHARRILCVGGKLLLHVHHRWAALCEPGGTRALARNAIQAMWHRDHEFGDTTYAYRGLPDMFLHRSSRRSLAQELREAGWDPVTMQDISIDGTKKISQAWLQMAGGFFVTATAS